MSQMFEVDLEAPCWDLVTPPIRKVKPDRYRRIVRDGHTIQAHRYMWQLFRGPIPNGMHLHHLCHNHTCVNPLHLEIVTVKEHRNQHPRHLVTRRMFMAEGTEPNSYLHKMKCLNCSLHFIVLSDDPKLRNSTPWCPECGKRGKVIIFGTEPTDKFIFQLVSA